MCAAARGTERAHYTAAPSLVLCTEYQPVHIGRKPTVPHFSSRSTCLVVAIVAVATTAPAQEGAKPRLELADTARAVTNAAGAVPASSRAPKPAVSTKTTGEFRSDFVRNQTLLGVAIYAPAFATTVAHDGIAWAASYLLVAGGSFVAAAEISRDMKITDAMQRLATGTPIRGAIAGAILASTYDGDARATAVSILVGSIGGTASALWLGRRMTDGEAAATLFGSDVLGLVAFAGATAAGLEAPGSPNKTRSGLTLAGMIVGAPLGQAYAALAPYNVAAGDLTAMTAAAGVGMLAGLSTVASGTRTDRQVAGALAIGGVAGLIVGDRLLVRRYDHTPAEGRLVVVGGVAGGLMGAGVALLTGGSQGRFNTFSAALTTLGAAGGIVLTQRYMLPKADGALRLGGLRMNPLGVVAAATGMRGAYTLGSLSF